MPAPPVPQTWARGFGAPELERLVAAALAQNLDVEAAGARFDQAEASAVVAEALSANPTSSVVALMFGTVADHDAVTAVAAKRGNLSVFARDGAVIGTRSGTWQVEADDPWVEDLGGSVAVRLGDFETFGAFLTSLHDGSAVA